MEITNEKMEQAYLHVRNRAITDEAFRKELLANPNKAIKDETGIDVPSDYRVRVIDYDASYQATFLLPPFAGEDVSDEDLAGVAGGSCIGNASACAQACGANK